VGIAAELFSKKKGASAFSLLLPEVAEQATLDCLFEFFASGWLVMNGW